MSDQDRVIKIKLNDEQKEQVRNETGKDAEALELSVQELEERIAPSDLGLNVRAEM